MPNQLITAPSFDAETLGGYNLAQVRDHTPKTHTHVEANITDLDHNALKVKGVIIDDTDIADQKVLAYDSGTERIVYIEQAPSGAAINSIQRFDEILGDELNTDITISEVDTSKTMILYNGIIADDNLDYRWLNSIHLLNSTTVRLTRYNMGASPRVAFTVVEFASGINNIQRGLTVLDDTVLAIWSLISSYRIPPRASTSFALYLANSNSVGGLSIPIFRISRNPGMFIS
ncbi:unnamed protein product [marine sediment metagenome]|uniref:Uncharacterized protein n=1 Tax=marine sediment metagenome TaxID=412755 RepID=X1GZ17_9ZZZZ